VSRWVSYYPGSKKENKDERKGKKKKKKPPHYKRSFNDEQSRNITITNEYRAFFYF
jgi:hypothetical protein